MYGCGGSRCISSLVQSFISSDNSVIRGHKYATSYIEQILEAIPHETKAVLPLTTHLQNYPSKTNKTRGTPLEKQGRTCKWRSIMIILIVMQVLADQQEFTCNSSLWTLDVAWSYHPSLLAGLSDFILSPYWAAEGRFLLVAQNLLVYV